jgi:hypothetical protein
VAESAAGAAEQLTRPSAAGARSKDGRLNGAVELKVSHVRPGQTAVLRADCHKDLVRPEESERFSLPDPQPKDREYYAEFGAG